MSRVVYKYTFDRYSSSCYGETDRHLKVKSEEYIRISPLIFTKLKPLKESATCDHLLICSNIPSFDEVAYGNRKYTLEVKESLLIKPARLVLNDNISSAKLFLFDNK